VVCGYEQGSDKTPRAKCYREESHLRLEVTGDGGSSDCLSFSIMRMIKPRILGNSTQPIGCKRW
jgi:hypothetical protein